MQKIQTKRTDIEVYVASAGQYYADAGAAMGVLPYKLWRDKVELDSAHRILMELNCLFIKTAQANILVDCGIGEYLSEKQIKIYSPGKFTLIDELASVGVKKEDIHLIAFTHLHFDHAGGVINKDKKLIFKNAKYIMQKEEWDIAMNPDTLNTASYSIKDQYHALSLSGKVETIKGKYEITSGIFLEKVGGHCPGMQIVKIDDSEGLIVFGGDIFPTHFHLNPSVTSAYDICRVKVCAEKEKIKTEIAQRGGLLIFGHEKIK